VRVVRDALPDNLPLFVTLRRDSGDGDELRLVWPGPTDALSASVAPHLADHVYLESVSTAEEPDPSDDERALDEAENERRVATWLVATRARLDEQLQKAARKQVKKAKEPKITVKPGQPPLDALDLDLQARDASDDFRVRAERALEPARRERDTLLETFDDQGMPVDVRVIAASATPLDSRIRDLGVALRRRRAASKRRTATFVVEVRLASPGGPIVAELGVAVFPPIEIEVQPYVVSLGGRRSKSGRSGDGLHRAFHASLPVLNGASPAPAAKASSKSAGHSATPPLPIDYAAFVTSLSLVNDIYAPVGLRFFTRASLVKCFRFADATDAPTTPEPADDPHGWNVYHPHFDVLFNGTRLELGRLNWQVPAPSSAAANGPVWRGRDDPWINLLMNAHFADAQHLHRLNVWCVRCLSMDHAPITSLAIGKGQMNASQPAETFTYVDAKRSFELELLDDQVGVVCALDPISKVPDPWHALICFASTVAHEIGHVASLTHYLGGQESEKPRPPVNDPWARRSLMSNGQFVERAVDVESDLPWTPPARHRRGAMLGLKGFAEIPLKPAEVTPPVANARTPNATVQTSSQSVPNDEVPGQEVAVIRETFSGTRYFGTGAR